MSARTTKIGDKTTATFEDGTTWSFELTRVEKNQLVELHCYEANHIHPVTTPEMRKEWENTILKFEIAEHVDGTTVRFSHIGLTPKINCYSICSTGWADFTQSVCGSTSTCGIFSY